MNTTSALYQIYSRWLYILSDMPFIIINGHDVLEFHIQRAPNANLHKLGLCGRLMSVCSLVCLSVCLSVCLPVAELHSHNIV